MRFILCTLLLSSLGLAQNLPVRHVFDGDPSEQLGRSVSYAGDVNSDGFADYITGGPLNATNGMNSGAARVMSGLDHSNLYTFLGAAAGDFFGEAVSDAGDVNNDGFGDIIIGAPGQLAFTGYAQVFSGFDGSVLYTRFGPVSGGGFGTSVAAAGDINSDGFDDFAVGAYLSVAGEVLVYSGFDGSLLRTHHGDVAGDNFGFSLSAVGDVDNDGFVDLAVGARLSNAGATSGGLVRVFSGQSGSVIHTFIGTNTSGKLGQAVGPAGDVDSDGFCDVVAGADVDPTGGTAAGRVLVFSGQTGLAIYDIFGTFAAQRLGFSVGGGLDLNGDGVSDFIAGAANNPMTGPSGEVIVYSGATGTVMNSFMGDGFSDRLGWSVAALGDIDGDGLGDIIAGAPIKSDMMGALTGQAKVLSIAGAESYGPVLGGMVFEWLHGIGGTPAQGLISFSGAPPSAPVYLGLSFAAANLMIFGIPVVVDVFNPTSTLITVLSDASGAFYAPVNLIIPGFAQQTIHFQAVAFSGAYSNGLELLFTN